MDTITELRAALDEAGWKVTRSAHGKTCPGCLYAALNGASLAKYDENTNTGYTGPGAHEATVTRKKSS